MPYVSVQQSACNTLAAWLSSSLDNTIECESFWPDASKNLPARAVTVIPAGPREEIWFEPTIVSVSNVGMSNTVSTWVVAALVQPLQLDVWATDEYSRDDILAQLDLALHAGVGRTLNISNADPFRQGVLLQMVDPPWDIQNVDCTFDMSTITYSPNAVNESEFRATLRGEAQMSLTMTATTPRMATIKLKDRLNASSGNYDLAITASTSGVSWAANVP